MALVLAASGVFAVWSHVVTRRHRELAIRGALGARPADLAALIGREAIVVAGAGVNAGVAASGFVRAFAFGVSPLDPRLLAVAVGVLRMVTLLATLVPALRAASIEPAVALRNR